jgi:hydroxypyruvate isomerase
MTRAFEDAVELAEKADVYLLLEALNNYDHPQYFLNNSSKTLQMVRKIGNKRLKMLYDVYHMQLSEGNIAQTLTKNLGDIGYIHFADAPGRHEPGTGELNFAFILERLKTVGFGGGIGFEFVPLAGDNDALISTRRQIGEGSAVGSEKNERGSSSSRAGG